MCVHVAQTHTRDRMDTHVNQMQHVTHKTCEDEGTVMLIMCGQDQE